jgi:hypothetical protein
MIASKPRLAPMLLGLALALGGCDDGDPPPDDAGAPRLVVGVGEGAFQSFEDGDTLDLVSGCQGLQHVWVALRTAGIAPRGVIVDLSLTRDRDGEVVSQPFLVRVTFDVGPDGMDEQVGLTLVVPDPEAAIGEDLTLRATVTDQDDVTLTAERPIRIAWGAGGCR